MSVVVYIALRPANDRADLHAGDYPDPRRLRRIAWYHRRAAAIVERLERDGWAMDYHPASVGAEHEAADTRAAAEARLVALGIDPAGVDIFDVGAAARAARAALGLAGCPLPPPP